MITILVLFHSNTFRNFKHFYLFYVCRELKEEFPIYFHIPDLWNVCHEWQFHFCSSLN